MTKKQAGELEDKLLGLGLGDVEREYNGRNDVTLSLRHPGHPRPIILERPSDWETWQIVLRHDAGKLLSERMGQVRDFEAGGPL